jgi:hypothetical protein
MPDATLRTIAGDAPAYEKPNARRPEYVDGESARKLSRAMYEGTRAVRAMGTEALPKWPAERMAFYRLRAKVAQVTRYYARTVDAIVGMVAGTPPTLAQGTDARIVADWENIDGRGTHGDVFVRDALADGILGGFAGILVDAPPVPDGVTLTLENEQRMGLRPYWVLIKAEQLVSWVIESPDWSRIMADYQTGLLRDVDVSRLSTQQIVRQVVIHEPTEVRSGAFGMTTRDRYRVLTLTDTGVEFVVWEHRVAEGGTGEHFAEVATGAMVGSKRAPLPAIPLALIYPKRPKAPFVAEPAVLGIAELNLDHHQITTDRRYLIRHTHSPTLYLFGVQAERDENGALKPIEVGPNSLIQSTNQDAKAGYISAPAEALDSSKDERDEIVRQIAALGMSFIAKDRQSGGTETAKGRGLDLAAENATHASMARGLQDGIEQALLFHARYRGAAEPSVEMHTAYASPAVDPQIAALLWQAVLHGKMDVDTWVEFLRTAKIPDGFVAADVVANLLAESEADRTADAERARDLSGDSTDDNLDPAA